MRIAFIGAVEFSRACLEEIFARGGEVAAVFTLRAEGTHYNADYADLGPLCERHGVPCHRVKNINDEASMRLLREARPDVIFVFGWSQLIGKPILELPPKGCIGTHPALLPRNRGRHPLIWALIEDLPKSGLTFFYLDEGADSGDILWQGEFEITDEDDASSLYAKMTALGRRAIGEFLPQLKAGTAPRRPQDHGLATTWRKRSREDGEIRWTSDSRTIFNLVRALARPYPGAHTFAGEEELKVWRAQVSETNLTAEEAAAAPGVVLRREGDGALLVRTGDGAIRITEFEGGPAGGAGPRPGERLGGGA